MQKVGIESVLVRTRWLTVFCLVVLLAGCATLSPDYEEPTVTVNSFRALPSDGMAPSFEIGLSIINPNAQTLNLAGVVYTISLQGHELVKGVGKDFEPIEGYSEGKITLTANANLFAGLRLFTDMAREPGEQLEYEFEAKLDLEGLYPSIRVREKGSFDFGGAGHNGESGS